MMISKPASDAYFCKGCNRWHDGIPMNVAYTLPDDIWAIPEPERADKAYTSSDLCRLGDRHFIRCTLAVPCLDHGEPFVWGAWAEVSVETFEEYLDVFESDARDLPPHPGVLANALPAYGHSFGRPVSVQFGDETTRPQLTCASDDETLLAVEQRNGIGSVRLHDLQAACGFLPPR